MRLSEAEHRRRRNGSVNRIAAVAQHTNSGRCRERMGGRRHRLTGDGSGTAWPLEVLHCLLFES
jgi:hypothetical protein